MVNNTVYYLLVIVSIYEIPPESQTHFQGNKTYSLVYILLLYYITGQPQNIYYRVGTGRVSRKEWFANIKESEMTLF
jgi:hypothetical protein